MTKWFTIQDNFKSVVYPVCCIPIKMTQLSKLMEYENLKKIKKFLNCVFKTTFSEGLISRLLKFC